MVGLLLPEASDVTEDDSSPAASKNSSSPSSIIIVGVVGGSWNVEYGTSSLVGAAK